MILWRNKLSAPSSTRINREMKNRQIKDGLQFNFMIYREKYYIQAYNEEKQEKENALAR